MTKTARATTKVMISAALVALLSLLQGCHQERVLKTADMKPIRVKDSSVKPPMQRAKIDD